MRLFRRTYKLPYPQDVISEYIGDLAYLNKLRDAALQKATLYGNGTNGSNVKSQRYAEEVDRYDDAIMVAQEVLRFMLEENVKGMPPNVEPENA